MALVIFKTFFQRKTVLKLGCVLWILVMASGSAWAGSTESQVDLVKKVGAALEKDLAPEMAGVMVDGFFNLSSADVDLEMLREDLELELIGKDRFTVVNAKSMADLGGQDPVSAGSEPRTDALAWLAACRAGGVDAIILGDLVETSLEYPELKGVDYFTTVLFRAISTLDARVIWQRKITGVNSRYVTQALGGIPNLKSIGLGEALGRNAAGFIEGSSRLQATGIEKYALAGLENRSGQPLNMLVLQLYMEAGLAKSTHFEFVDVHYLSGVAQRLNGDVSGVPHSPPPETWARRLGVDGLIQGTIRSVTPDSLECVLRVSQVGTGTDIDAGKLTAVVEYPAWHLPTLLAKAGPCRFTSNPAGAIVIVAGDTLGISPCEAKVLRSGFLAEFHMEDYDTHSVVVDNPWGEGQSVHAELALSFSAVSIRTQPSESELKLNGEIQGVSPLHDLRLPHGDYRVAVSRRLFENSEVVVTINEPVQDFMIEMAPRSRRKSILYSLLLPGTGQRYKGQEVKGWAFTAGVVCAATYALVNESARKSAVEDFDTAKAAYMSAITQEEIDYYFSQMESNWDEADEKEKRRNTGWVVCGGIWALNVIDAALGWNISEAGVVLGPTPAGTGGSGVAVSIWR